MRQSRNPQLSLYHIMPRNKVAQDLNAISSVLDENREMLDLVYQDIIGLRKADTGRTGLRAEQVLLSLQRILEIRTYKTVWVMGHKIRPAMAERDADYKLAGLIELDDTYVGGPKPGKRGRGAVGKSKVVVAVETPGDKPRFAAMRQVPRVSGDEIKGMAQACLAAKVVARTDGWQAYRVLNSESSFHVPAVTGLEKKRPDCFPGSIP